jgi:TolB-like protein/DNA-binding winged helix-turn-helix (wHTH) protein/Flp pilus assembly protein TadD
MPDTTQAPLVRRFGVFEINFQSGELRKNGIRLRLSGQPFQVLEILIERAGEVVTREELHSRLWPADTFVDFDHGLNNAVAKIREVLDDSSGTPRYVETIPRRGYRFIAPLTDAPPATVSPQPADPIRDSAGEAVRADASVPAPVPARKRITAVRLRILFGGFVVLILLAVGMVLYLRRTRETGHAAIKSLAVLPLKNLSGDPNQEYLADGMTEEIIGRLSSIRNLRVISRTSVMRFKESPSPVPEIAKALNVDAVLEGSVIREGNRIRVHAQLIRAATDEHFWSQTYDRQITDALALESELAQSVAEKVEITVTGQERQRLTAARPVAPEVYELFLKGLSALNRNETRASVDQGIDYLEQAVKLDPSFAPAYVGLAFGHQHRGTVVIGAASHEEERAKGMSAAQTALQLDPDLPDAHVALAELYRIEWRWAEAEGEYRRALELNPNDAMAHAGLANWLLCQGRIDEALPWARRGRELDPLVVSGHSVGWALYIGRHYDDAIRELESALKTSLDDIGLLWTLGFVLVANNQPREAIPVLERALIISNRSPGVIGVLIRAYVLDGRRAEALKLLDELKQLNRKAYVPAAAFVNAYLGLGDKDQVFVWLEQAYKEKAGVMEWMKVDPMFDSVRNDPRFADLLRRVGLN